MKVSQLAPRALAFVLLFGSAAVAGQAYASYGVDETAIEWVNRASKIAPASVDTAFGDQLSLYDGSVEFNTVDVSVPGTGPAVELRRSFPVRDMNYQLETGIPQGSGERKELGDWSLDLPQLSGVFEASVGWEVEGDAPNARCSSGDRPRYVSLFEATEYWSGNELHIPGGVSENLLLNHNTARPSPTDGKAYPWTTKSGWMISCTTATANGYPGEGFVATGPDGTRYYLDWVVKRPYPGLTGPQYYSAFSGQYNIAKIGRNKIYFLASKVIDRFGNQVTYNYLGDLLTSITASDGRAITLQYKAGRLTSVTAGSQTWAYAYAGDDYLQSVTLPDASQWTYARTGKLSIEHETGMELKSQTHCMVQAPMGEDFLYAVTNPAGLRGDFKFRITGHNKRNVPEYCKAWQYGRIGQITTVRYWQIPLRSIAYSLVQKDISGVGVPAATWTYDYNPLFMGLGAKGFHDDCVADPSVCPLSKTVLVSGPSKFERYTYGIWWGLNDGQLLKKEVGTSADNILYSEDYTYITEDEAAAEPFGNQVGSQVHDYLDRLGSYNRPLKTVVKTLQGATFRRSNLAFDIFARPTSTQAASSLGYSRTDALAYTDQLSKWVIGQLHKTTCTAPSTCAGLVESQTDYDPASALPIRSYRFGKLQQVLSYNTDGTIAAVQDGAGNKTTFSNWKRGLPQKVTYPATRDQPAPVSETAVVNAEGWVTSVTDATGAKTCYAHDAMGRIAGVTYSSEAAVGVCDTSTWAATARSFTHAGTAYGLPAGNWKDLLVTGDAVHRTYRDALWRPVVEDRYDATSAVATRSIVYRRYDASGRLAFESYPTSTVTSYLDEALAGVHTTYDALDRPVQVQRDSEVGPLTSIMRYLSGFETEVTDPRNTRTVTAFQAYDQPTTDWPVAISAADGKAEAAWTLIDRDVFGKPLAITRRNPAGTVSETRTYRYDAAQQLCATVEPETDATLMGYDGAGNLAWSAAGLLPATACSATGNTAAILARKAVRDYDPRNRLLGISYADHRADVAFSYTPDGKLESTTAYNGGTDLVTTTYAYNHRRLMTGERMVSGNKDWRIGYGYDANGHLAQLAYPSNLSVALDPNALGQPTRAGSYATGVTYYPNGALRQFTYGNGIVHTLQQNARGLPERSRDAYGATAVLDDSYDYDGNGNVLAISDGLPGNRGDRTMTYDGLDRLLTATSPMFNGTVATYAYDVLDNLTAVKAPGRDHVYVYDAHWRLTNVLDAALGSTVVGLGYDVQGNVSNKKGMRFDFDQGNRLRAVSGTASASYLYDGHGRRVRDVTTGPKWSLYSNAGQLLYADDERTGSNTSYVYLGGSLVAGVSTLGRPVLSVPAETTGSTYTVSWTKVAHATTYRLEERARFALNWTQVLDGNALGMEVTGKTPGTYDYRVRACDATSCGDYSGISSIQVTAATVPVLSLTGADGDGTYSVVWTSIAQASRYELQEKIGTGTWTLIQNSTARSKAFAGKAPGSYSYRVRACLDTSCGQYSTEAVAFVNGGGGQTVPAMPGSFVGHTAIHQGPGPALDFSFSWSASPGATFYELQIDNKFFDRTLYQGANTSYTYGADTTQKTYRVRACNELGVLAVERTSCPAGGRAMKVSLRALIPFLFALALLPGWSHAQIATYYHTDALGSPVAVTDQSRNVVERSEYEPYGKVLGGVEDGPGYTGHVSDAATGLSYMQQRYYDPGIGRFLSVDPVTAYEKPMTNFNRYVYALNNPYRFTDPDGRQSIAACAMNPANAAVCAEAGIATSSGTAGAASSSSGGSGVLAGILTAIGLDWLIQRADSAQGAVDKLSDGKRPADGAEGKKGVLVGEGGSGQAEKDFDNIDGTEIDTGKEGVRVKTLDGGGRVEIHDSTGKNPNVEAGTRSIKVQDESGKVIKTIRYPDPKS